MLAARVYWSAAAGGLLLADSLVLLAIGGGANLGTLLPGAVGVGLIAYFCSLRRSGGWIRPAWNRRIRVVLGLMLVVGLIPFFIVEGLIAASAFPKSAAPSPWLLVLGAGLRGGTPSLTLQQRLYSALDYLKRNPEAQAIVSGGQGHGETMSEAEAMFRFLTEHGVAANRLIKEERSTSTFENLRFCKKILDANGPKPGESVTVISSGFHLFRVKFLARRAGLGIQVIAAPSPWYLVPNTCTREFFAVIKSFVLDR